jgi:hypothetical protein
LQAILVADHVYEDRSGKRVIAGTFNGLAIGTAGPGLREQQIAGRTLQVSEVIQAGSPFAYLNLTGLHGPTELTLRYVDLADNSVLFQIVFSLAPPNSPLETVELSIPLPKLPAPHEGVYALELLCGDDWLGSHRINVIKLPGPETTP